MGSGQRRRQMSPGALPRWLLTRRSLRVEALSVLLSYALYEASRGIGHPDLPLATHHAQDVVAVERSLHVFTERHVQDAAGAVPGLVGTLGFLYLTLHLAVTSGCLIWLHRRHPSAFPFVRTTLVLASGLALIGYLVFPTAPPRLAGIGIADTISNGQVDLNKGLISSLYNPFAAVPSMHAGYAVVVGASLLRLGSHRAVRIAGAMYPALVLVVIVATGNHFLLDAVAGVAVAGLAAAATVLLEQRRRVHTPEAVRAHHPLLELERWSAGRSAPFSRQS